MPAAATEPEPGGPEAPAPRRGFRDRDYLVTPEGLAFCVVGNVHPPGRVVAYLKYQPAEPGEAAGRLRRALRHYTVGAVKETLRLLENRYPHYLFFDDTIGETFSGVPLNRVEAHLKPEEKLRDLAQSERRDGLQALAVQLAEALGAEAKVQLGSLGVTGSILLGVHHPAFSDLDLTVYGFAASVRVKEALAALYGSAGFERLRGGRLEAWCAGKAKLHPLTPGELAELYRRSWNRGVFRGVPFSVHPVRLEGEVGEAYGERVYKPLGAAEAEATISDAAGSLFLPSTYGVESVRFRLGGAEPTTELVSYDGLYTGVFEAGERVVVRGLLERVEHRRKGFSHHRILVGSMRLGGRDFIKPKSA